MAKRFTSGLSAKGFRNLAKQVREYRFDLTDKCKEFAKALAEEGVTIARMEIIAGDAILTGELLSSMKLEAGDVVFCGGSYLVYTDCPWAQYVEFGTGIVGEGNPHPNMGLGNWKYDVNEHGEKGWFYFKNGEWHWTKGMKSRPFMYNTAQRLKDSETIARIAKEVFGK